MTDAEKALTEARVNVRTAELQIHRVLVDVPGSPETDAELEALKRDLVEIHNRIAAVRSKLVP
jgi:hypothetical protein